MRVLVIDRQKKALMPCHPARARELLKKGKAAVFRKYPFTIILHKSNEGKTQEIELKIDPGSKISGIALVALCKRGRKVILSCNLHHRGEQIRSSLESRRALRRGRRSRKTRGDGSAPRHPSGTDKRRPRARAGRTSIVRLAPARDQNACEQG